MNNNITEDYCSYEVSKLLKEKGFNVGCKYYYDLQFKERSFHYTHTDEFTNSNMEKGLGKLKYPMISCPTHSIAIKFIRENFRPDFCINIFPYTYRNKTLYEVRIFGHHFTESQFKKPELGIDSALLYTLKNLI